MKGAAGNHLYSLVRILFFGVACSKLSPIMSDNNFCVSKSAAETHGALESLWGLTNVLSLFVPLAMHRLFGVSSRNSPSILHRVPGGMYTIKTTRDER